MHPAKASGIEIGRKTEARPRWAAQYLTDVSVWPGWLVLLRPVLERPTTGPVQKAGCWLRPFFCCCCFLSSRPPQRPRSPSTRTGGRAVVVVETSFLCLLQCARSVCQNEETRCPSSMWAEKTQEIGQRTSQTRNKIVVLSGTGREHAEWSLTGDEALAMARWRDAPSRAAGRSRQPRSWARWRLVDEAIPATV
ncbi:hypothetical protein PVAR5_5356 [Paecilomyces variotii No. 5]|uniref:Uncharacterized protein n=1 Tax=Byssochlamys spectabilis (strain No. 5 / NBRC 109023) TaxID=1356009 RepID=V5FX83_BYSSN|nr:hypothetical protein PVAR5_5356 [Paecilomyces variotii No. 5]